MKEIATPDDREDPFDLVRFTSAQETVYAAALSELKHGQKRTHWMWFIFPQIAGLGLSTTSQQYAIHSLDEAQCYLSHPVLGTRLRECAEAVLAIEGHSAFEIFGFPDDLKLKSSMTLFAQVAGKNSVFTQLLKNYFNGERDMETMRKLEPQTNQVGLP